MIDFCDVSISRAVSTSVCSDAWVLTEVLLCLPQELLNFWYGIPVLIAWIWRFRLCKGEFASAAAVFG